MPWDISEHILNTDKVWGLLPSVTFCPELAAEIQTDFILYSFGLQTVLVAH